MKKDKIITGDGNTLIIGDEKYGTVLLTNGFYDEIDDIRMHIVPPREVYKLKEGVFYTILPFPSEMTEDENNSFLSNFEEATKSYFVKEEVTTWGDYKQWRLINEGGLYA